MSSIPMSRVCNRASCAMLLAGLVVLFVGNGMARSDLVASANGANSTSTTPQTTVGTTPINITAASVNGSSGIYDLNSVVYLTNSSATAQTVTAQYTVGGTGVGQTFSLQLAAGASQSVSIPQQVTAQPGTATVGLRVIDTTGGAGNTVTINSSSLAVTGYTVNGGTATVSAPGSSNLPTTTIPSATPPITPVSVANVGGAGSQGLVSVNSALSIINSSGAVQSVSAVYTVDGTATGSAFSLTLPGSGSTLVALPSQLTLTPGTTHTIGIQITDTGGAGISIGAGSTISATAYKTSGGAPSATGQKAANQNLGSDQNLTFLGSMTAVQLTIPALSANGATFYDANASIMLSSFNGSAASFSAQYMDGTTPLGPIFTLNLPANGVANFSLPEQFSTASLTPGTTLSVLLSAVGGSAVFNLDADTLTLVAHNNVPGVSTPEPASLSLAAMAAMAFGAAAYKKRKSSKVQV